MPTATSEGWVVVKLGGALITDKKKPFTLNRDSLSRAVAELAKVAARSRLVVVHGGGSYGHYVVSRFRESPLKLVTEVAYWMCALNMEVIAAFRKHGIPAIGVPTFSVVKVEEGSPVIDLGLIREIVDIGAVPVTYGGLARSGRGFEIVSGDVIASELAIGLKAEALVFLMEVKGVYSADPRRNPNAKLLKIFRKPDLESVKGGSGGIDVTGGIRLKLEAALKAAEAGIKVALGRPEELTAMIKGLDGDYTRVIP